MCRFPLHQNIVVGGLPDLAHVVSKEENGGIPDSEVMIADIYWTHNCAIVEKGSSDVLQGFDSQDPPSCMLRHFNVSSQVLSALLSLCFVSVNDDSVQSGGDNITGLLQSIPKLCDYCLLVVCGGGEGLQVNIFCRRSVKLYLENYPPLPSSWSGILLCRPGSLNPLCGKN